MELNQKFKEAIFLVFLSLACFGLSLLRWEYTDTRLFLFLNWNLFLAAIPWVLSSFVATFSTIQSRRLLVGLLLLVWLAFFPNAPYILTDLLHLRLRPGIPIWFDLILILSFAWTGLLFGLLSLRDIEHILGKQFSIFWTTVISLSLIFISSFGIYLGRFLRWNTWDIIHQPTALLYDIGACFSDPLSHTTAWGITLLMGLFLNVIHWSLKLLRQENLLPSAAKTKNQ